MIQPLSGPMAVVSQNQPRPQLRRAVYVHVSDLISPYNIDHNRLEEELTRVNTEREMKKSFGSDQARVSGGSSASDPETTQAMVSHKKLHPPRSGYNLCVLVGKVEVVVDKHRVDGSRVRLAEVEVGDETGLVSLRARDEQIDILQEVSQRKGAVVLRNCTLELYQGKHIRLAVTKWGKISTYPDKVASTPPPPSRVNLDRHFSLIDLSLVASEMTEAETYSPADIDVHHGTSSSTGASRILQTYGTHPGQSQSRRGGRRQSRASGKSGISGGGMIQASYHGGPHTYGTGYSGEGHERQHSALFPTRPPEPQSMQQQHQHHIMMAQHQYEIQQRQLQQMYHSSQDSQRLMPVAATPMMGTGMYSAGGFGHVDLPGAPRAPPTGFHQSPGLQRPNLSTSTGINAEQSGQHESTGPNLARMNPEAAKYDPMEPFGRKT